MEQIFYISRTDDKGNISYQTTTGMWGREVEPKKLQYLNAHEAKSEVLNMRVIDDSYHYAIHAKGFGDKWQMVKVA